MHETRLEGLTQDLCWYQKKSMFVILPQRHHALLIKRYGCRTSAAEEQIKCVFDDNYEIILLIHEAILMNIHNIGFL